MTGFFDYDGAGTADQRSAPDDFDVVLSGLDDDDWRQIREHSEIRRYRAGEVVIDEGDTSRDLFIVLSGEASASVRVGRQGARRAGQPMRAGAVFGEIAFFAGGRRTASVVAGQDTELLRLRFDEFHMLAAQDPHLAQRIVFDLGRVLAGRLIRAERAEGSG
ncbi:MAG TPA: cyclic nucleotide-binding domain-containing protein [Jatrophihabitans sp.]|jgi:CRP-like cAMP-binding protein|nr:cyclic nucleotide-binding domain-containing protein [Jatrophihabitans sp.]